MRRILTGLGVSVGLCVGMGSTALVLAESPNPNTYEKDVAVSTSHQMTTAEQRIYERASLEARERLARIESRHRQGISMVRPSVTSGFPFTAEIAHGGPWCPSWFYTCP